MARRVFKTILVAIGNPHAAAQPGLAKAAQLASRTGARLVLFHSAFDPYLVSMDMHPSARQELLIKQGMDRTVASRRDELEKLAAPLRRKRLKVSVRAVWDYPVFEAIVREVLHLKPDLVVAETHRHLPGARLFLANTDWQLIRLCPAPLLFVKRAAPWRTMRVLAAVDPLHSHDKPAHLDARILEMGQALAAASRGRLDVVHAHLPLSTFIAGPAGDPLLVPLDPAIERDQEDRIKKALQRLVAPLRISASRLHMRLGITQPVLTATAQQLAADVVVMGAVSRRGLDRLIIGSTAERAIDRLPCDVLVVKPAKFKTSVPKRANLGAR